MIEKDNVFQVCKLRINIAFLNERYCKIKSSVTKMIGGKYRWWVATDHERGDNFPKKKKKQKANSPIRFAFISGKIWKNTCLLEKVYFSGESRGNNNQSENYTRPTSVCIRASESSVRVSCSSQTVLHSIPFLRDSVLIYP